MSTLRLRAAAPFTAHCVTSCSFNGQCVATESPPAPQNKINIPSLLCPKDSGALYCVAAAHTRFVESSINTNENLCDPLNVFNIAFKANDRSFKSAFSSRIFSNCFPIFSALSVSLTNANEYASPSLYCTLCVVDRAMPPHVRASTL